MKTEFSPRVFVLAILSGVCLVGCSGEEPPYRKPTFSVKGKMTVDGAAPGEPMQIKCIPISQEDSDPSHTSFSETMSLPSGEFQISTYESGDGVPNGEYVLAIVWGKLNLMTRSYGGPDKLQGEYSDAKKSPFKFTVSGAPVDLGSLDVKVPTAKKPESKVPDVELGNGEQERVIERRPNAEK